MCWHFGGLRATAWRFWTYFRFFFGFYLLLRQFKLFDTFRRPLPRRVEPCLALVLCTALLTSPVTALVFLIHDLLNLSFDEALQRSTRSHIDHERLLFWLVCCSLTPFAQLFLWLLTHLFLGRFRCLDRLLGSWPSPIALLNDLNLRKRNNFSGSFLLFRLEQRLPIAKIHLVLQFSHRFQFSFGFLVSLWLRLSLWLNFWRL